MAAYTSSQTGNWSNPATWGGAGTPGDGDTASIGAHTVTVDANTTVGTSPNNNTTNVISLTSASSVLIVAAGITLTVKGNIGHVNDSTQTQQAGSTLTFDNSGSGGTPVYRFQNVGFTKFNFNGSSVSGATIQAIAGQTFGMGVAWALFTATYLTVRRCSSMTITSISGNVNVSDSTFDACTQLSISTTSSSINIIFDRNTFVNGTHATIDFNVTTTNAAASGTRRLQQNKLAKILSYSGKSFLITKNYFGGGINCVAGATWTNRLNFIKQDGTLNSGNGALYPTSCERNYFVVENSGGNPHHIAPTALLSVDNVVSQCVFESYTPDLVDTGDCILVNSSATSGGFKVIGKNNIVLVNSHPSAGGVSSGCLLTLFNASAAVVTEWYRNTANINNSAVANKRGVFAIAEGGTGTAGQVAQLKSNLAWGSSASQGYLGERVTGNVKDIITAANADRNWTYNLSAGDNQRGYEDKAAANTLWTAGDAVAAGVDANQGTGDPQFVDSSRNLAAWAVARGYGADYAAALTALQADTTRVVDLIDYVFEGFKVANASMRNVAHDGGVVGTANYHKSSRLLTDITNLRSYATAKYGVTV